MTQGTKSYLFGCHSFIIHPICILIAWIKEYKSFPCFWEICCIFLHDIGHIGKQYLSDPKQKIDHWILGALIARKLFGEKGFSFIAGHTNKSKYPRSKLFIPDKKSWLYSPKWWLILNDKIEDFGAGPDYPDIWIQMVRENAEAGFPKGSHDMYLEYSKYHN